MRYTIHPAAGLIVTLSTGHVSGAEFVETYREVFAAPDFRPGQCELADLRGMTGQCAGAAEFRQVALMVRDAHGPLIGRARVAILVGNRFQFGMSRMYGAHAEALESEAAETFEDPGKALSWLRADLAGVPLHAAWSAPPSGPGAPA